MAFTFRSQYDPDADKHMRAFYQTFSERDRRRFVAVEAQRLGHSWWDHLLSGPRVLLFGTPVSAPVIADCLDDQGLKRRKVAKTLAGCHSPDRDTQFQRIALLKTESRSNSDS